MKFGTDDETQTTNRPLADDNKALLNFLLDDKPIMEALFMVDDELVMK